MGTNDTKKTLTKDEVDRIIKPGELVHTLRQAGPFLLGGEVTRKKLLLMAQCYGAELAGESATAMHHGVVVYDKTDPVFCDTGDAIAEQANNPEQPIKTANQELLDLVDGAYEIVEMWDAVNPSQVEWKRAWLEKARKHGASGE